MPASNSADRSEEHTEMNHFLQMLFLTIAVLACSKPDSFALERTQGWWVVVGSFPTEPWQRQQDDFNRMHSSAILCGLDVFNDFSGKFRGFRAGYNVFVLGAFEDESIARETLATARKCFPDPYVKYGEYLGE